MTATDQVPCRASEDHATVSRHLQSIEGLAALAEAIAVGDEGGDQESKLIYCGELVAAIRLLADAGIARLDGVR